MKSIHLTFALLPWFTMPLAAQTVRSWNGTSGGTWHTVTNWSPNTTFAGEASATVTGEGLATDIMSVTAANASTNIGINMNTLSGGAGGLGLTLGAIDWNKTNTAATTMGNNSTTVGGVLRINGATVNSVADTLIRVAGAANLTIATANTGTPTAAQTLQLQLGQTNGIFHVEPARTLTFSMNSLTGAAPNTGWTLDGGGQFVISAPSVLDGPVRVVSGRAQASHATAYGSGAVEVASGGQAWLTASVANHFNIAGQGWTEAAGLLGAMRFSNTASSGSVTLTGPARLGAFNGNTGALNGPLLGSAALEINGPETNFNGTISLNGSAAGFSGPVTVHQGRLNVNHASGPAGALSVADGAGIGGEGTLGGTLTLGTAAGAQIFADASTPGVLTAAGDVTVNGVATVNLTAPGPSPVRVLKTNGTLNAGAASFTLPGGIAGYRPGSGFDTTTTTGEVLLTLVTEDLTWSGAATPDWNGTDANWTGGGGQFFQGDRVTFGDSGVADVNVPANVLPGKVTVETSTDRSFAGAGAIEGTTQLVKRGGGKLTVSNVNTYSGGTLIEGGVLDVNAVDAVPGAGGLTVSSGILRVTPINGLSAATAVTLGDANSATAATVLEIPAAASADQTVLSTPVTLSPAAPDAKAILRYPGTATSGGASTFTGQVTLNGRDLWLENTSNSGAPVTQRLWNMNGKITGAGNVHVAVPSAASRVRIMFNGNDFAGHLYIHSGMLQVGNGGGGTNNCIPDTADVIMSAGTRMGMGTSDTIGALTGGAADPGNSLAAALVNPNTSTVSPTLTVGAGNRSGVYDGDTGNESTRTLALTKIGTGTQTLNGACAHTGNTSVSAGKLVINGTYASAITVSGGATLAGTGTSTAAITATSATNGGANVAPGNSPGTLTAASANLSTGGNLIIALDGAQSSKLAVSGVLNITNAELLVTGSGAGGVYVIASYGTLTGTFATVPAGYNVDYAHNDGVSSNNIAITAPSDPYAAWAASKGLTAANNAQDFDAEGDGVVNALEFYLDGNPLAGDAPGLTASTAGGNLRVTYKRRDDAELLNVVPQASTTLAAGSWTTLQHGVDGVVINVFENAAAPDDVEILIPAGGARLFARLLLTLP